MEVEVIDWESGDTAGQGCSGGGLILVVSHSSGNIRRRSNFTSSPLASSLKPWKGFCYLTRCPGETTELRMNITSERMKDGRREYSR
jgi:hypothetical protein